MYSLFVCGAPHNKKGFEFTNIEGDKVPSTISQYLDIFDPSKMNDGSTYIIQKISIQNKEYTLITNYIGINPSDQKTSRGAYIAVGVLVDISLPLSSTISYFCKIEAIQASLKVLRNERNAFSPTFDMQNEVKNIDTDYNHVPFLVHLAHKLTQSSEVKKMIFNNVEHKNIVQDIDNNSLVDEIEEQKNIIKQCQEELRNEKEVHKLTINESKMDISSLQNKIENLEMKLEYYKKTEYVGDISGVANTNDMKGDNRSHQFTNNSGTYAPPPSRPKRKPKEQSFSFGNTSNKKNNSFLKIILYVIIVLLTLFIFYAIYDYVNSNSNSTSHDQDHITTPTTKETMLKPLDLETQKEEVVMKENVKIDTPNKKIDINITETDKPENIQKEPIDSWDKVKELN